MSNKDKMALEIVKMHGISIEDAYEHLTKWYPVLSDNITKLKIKD